MRPIQLSKSEIRSILKAEWSGTNQTLKQIQFTKHAPQLKYSIMVIKFTQKSKKQVIYLIGSVIETW